MAMIKLIVLVLIISSTFVDGRVRRRRRQLSSSYYGQSSYPYSSSSYYGAGSYNPSTGYAGGTYPYNTYGSGLNYGTGMYGQYGSGMYGQSGSGMYGQSGSGMYGQYGQGYPYNTYGGMYGGYNTQYPYGTNYNYQYPNIGTGSYGYGQFGGSYGSGMYGGMPGYGSQYGYYNPSNPWYRTSRSGGNTGAQGRSGGAADGKVADNSIGSNPSALIDKPRADGSTSK